METLIDYFIRVAQYRWWEVAIELILIGLVVYWAVDFLEGTRGERLFRGVVFVLIFVVLILNLVVEKFGFERLQYLFKGFLIFVLIITVAAFQPEVRRALIRIGRPRFLTGSEKHFSRTIEEIIAAVTQLSAERIGAIIVIEQQVALGEFIETGVRIDAMVTSELIRTIFQPGSALHDMAVIIRADRLVAARVQLPLTEAAAQERTGAQLGSRHRAAMGITAGSDAICLVVSEETGGVSIAHSGKLTRRVTANQLRAHLTGTIEKTTTSVFAALIEKFRISRRLTEKETDVAHKPQQTNPAGQKNR